MKNTLFEKHHMLFMILACLIPMLLLFGAFQFFNLKNTNYVWLIMLLCPLLHVFMMKDMHKNHSGDSGEDKKCH